MLAAEFPVNFKLLILQSLRGELSTTDYSMERLSEEPRKLLIWQGFDDAFSGVKPTADGGVRGHINYLPPSRNAIATWLSTSMGRPLSR